MSKFITDFVTKVGVDKCLHFSLGGLISALVSIIILLQESYTTLQLLIPPTVGAVIVFCLSIIKENMDAKVTQNTFNNKDILAGMLGTLTVYIAIGLGLLIKLIC